ncbi:unnamed protein product, partial [Rotaria magnacalcarata]
MTFFKTFASSSSLNHAGVILKAVAFDPMTMVVILNL